MRFKVNFLCRRSFYTHLTFEMSSGVAYLSSPDAGTKHICRLFVRRSCVLFMRYVTQASPPAKLLETNDHALMLQYLGLPGNLLEFFDVSGTSSLDPVVQRSVELKCRSDKMQRKNKITQCRRSSLNFATRHCTNMRSEDVIGHSIPDVQYLFILVRLVNVKPEDYHFPARFYLNTTTTTILFFFYLNASTLNNIDTVRPGGGEKTLRSSRLPPPKYMLSKTLNERAQRPWANQQKQKQRAEHCFNLNHTCTFQIMSKSMK